MPPRLPRLALRRDLREHARRPAPRAASPPTRIEVHHPGIRWPRAAAAPAGRRAARRIVYVGRLEPYKNVDVLLRALARAAAALSRRRARGRRPGRGPRAPRAPRATSSASRARVRFTGFVDDAERDRLLACVARLRLRVGEGGLGPHGDRVERARHARSSRATRPGLRDSVRDGETGFLVPVGDADALRRRASARCSATTRCARACRTAARAFARALRLGARGRSDGGGARARALRREVARARRSPLLAAVSSRCPWRSALRVHNALHYPPEWGFDATFNWEYIEALRHASGTCPRPTPAGPPPIRRSTSRWRRCCMRLRARRRALLPWLNRAARARHRGARGAARAPPRAGRRRARLRSPRASCSTCPRTCT